MFSCPNPRDPVPLNNRYRDPRDGCSAIHAVSAATHVDVNLTVERDMVIIARSSDVFPASGPSMFILQLELVLYVYCLATTNHSSCDLSPLKSLFHPVTLCSKMKSVSHLIPLLTPVLSQISDPLRYVDPLIGSSNGGTASLDVFFDQSYEDLLIIVQEMSSPAPLCLMVWRKRRPILTASRTRADLLLMGVMLLGKQVESEDESIDLDLLLTSSRS